MTGKVFFGSAECKISSLQENGLVMENKKIKFQFGTYRCHHRLVAHPVDCDEFETCFNSNSRKFR